MFKDKTMRRNRWELSFVFESCPHVFVVYIYTQAYLKEVKEIIAHILEHWFSDFSLFQKCERACSKKAEC